MGTGDGSYIQIDGSLANDEGAGDDYLAEGCNVWLQERGAGGLEIWFYNAIDLDSVTFRCERGADCDLYNMAVSTSPYDARESYVAVPTGAYDGVSPRNAAGGWPSHSRCTYSGGAWWQEEEFGGYIAF